MFIYNYFVWTLAYFIGLQFTHADQGIMQEFVLDWNVMKNWPPVLWAVFFALVAFLLVLVVTVFKLYIALGILKWYLLAMGVFASWFYIKAKAAKDVHIHHYCIGAAVVSVCCYQDAFITFVSGIFTGIMIEGGSRWAYDPVFTYDEEEETLNDGEV